MAKSQNSPKVLSTVSNHARAAFLFGEQPTDFQGGYSERKNAPKTLGIKFEPKTLGGAKIKALGVQNDKNKPDKSGNRTHASYETAMNQGLESRET